MPDLGEYPVDALLVLDALLVVELTVALDVVEALDVTEAFAVTTLEVVATEIEVVFTLDEELEAVPGRHWEYHSL
jgi:hypothetical protein